jgi:replicative DNA helicase
MLTSAQRFVAAVIQTGSIEKMLGHGPVRHLFTGEETKLWAFFEHHVNQYGTMPDFALVKADTGFDLGDQPQPAEFYLDRARDNHIAASLTTEMSRTHEKYLKGGAGLPAEGLAYLQNKVMALSVENMGSQVLDYRDAQDLMMKAYVAKANAGDSMGMALGWPTLDAMTSGLTLGDMISLAGRPGVGKTWFMLWAAMHAWKTQGKVPLFISMEIKPLPIVQRLLAIQAQLPFKGLRDAELSSTQKKIMKAVMGETAKGEIPFYIVDGNLTATVADLHALTRQLKPDLVVIDGAYLLTHPTERDLYKKVAVNAGLIKTLICDLAPTICSWQFARPKRETKAGKKQPQGADEVGSSDVIYQLSSLMLGIREDESSETVRQRKVSVMKGRNGEDGEFTVKWDFDWTTDFSEIVESQNDMTKFSVT